MSNPNLVVSTPRGEIVTVTTKSGKVTAKLTWSANFGTKKTNDFSRAQKFLDSEILRATSPYVPFRTGALIKSGQLGTVVGSGEVSWITPYAKRQYYSTAESRSYDAQRGGMWFERAKADHKGEWVDGTKRIAGGK
jgi:hypothetical protein